MCQSAKRELTQGVRRDTFIICGKHTVRCCRPSVWFGQASSASCWRSKWLLSSSISLTERTSGDAWRSLSLPGRTRDKRRRVRPEAHNIQTLMGDCGSARNKICMSLNALNGVEDMVNGRGPCGRSQNTGKMFPTRVICARCC